MTQHSSHGRLAWADIKDLPWSQPRWLVWMEVVVVIVLAAAIGYDLRPSHGDGQPTRMTLRYGANPVDGIIGNTNGTITRGIVGHTDSQDGYMAMAFHDGIYRVIPLIDETGGETSLITSDTDPAHSIHSVTFLDDRTGKKPRRYVAVFDKLPVAAGQPYKGPVTMTVYSYQGFGFKVVKPALKLVKDYCSSRQAMDDFFPESGADKIVVIC